MNTAQLIAQLRDAHAELVSALDAHHQAILHHAQAKAEFDDARMELIRDGVDGKNAETREAFIHGALPHQRQTLLRSEEALAQAKHELELARLSWELARYTVRIHELELETEPVLSARR